MSMGIDNKNNTIWYCKKCKTQVFCDYRCPKCGTENFSEVTGWCIIYSEPLINGECITGPDHDMCPACIIDKVDDVFYCESCDTFYSYDEYISWNDIMGYSHCPIGNQDIKQIIIRYDECIEDAIKVLNFGFEKISLVFIVTSFELASKELFLRSSNSWFYYLEDEEDPQPEYTKEEIIKIIKKLKLPIPFYKLFKIYIEKIETKKERIINRKELNDFLKKELFSELNYQKYQYKVNFNRLNGRGSFPWLYNEFLLINIIKKFQIKGDDKWKYFVEFVKKRHRIIHNYSQKIDKLEVMKGKVISSEIIEYIQSKLNAIF